MIAAREQELLENFSFCDTWEERYLYLMELGRAMPPLPLKEGITTLPGCMSQVWLVCSCDPLKGMHILADSDSLLVKGLLGLARSLYEGAACQEVAQHNAQSFLSALGLKENLSPQRRQGLATVLQALKRCATEGR